MAVKRRNTANKARTAKKGTNTKAKPKPRKKQAKKQQEYMLDLPFATAKVKRRSVR